MAHARPNYVDNDTSILLDNTDHLEVDNVFNEDIPMSNIELEQLSQELDDSELIIQTEGKEMSQNAAPDLEAMQCEEVDELLSETAQRYVRHKNKTQLQKESVIEAQAKLNKKLKREAENYPLKQPKTKPRRTDCSPVWYFST